MKNFNVGDRVIASLDETPNEPQHSIESKYKIKSKRCVNSKWSARWIVEGEEYCQCGFECKIIVVHIANKYDYVVTEEEARKIGVFPLPNLPTLTRSEAEAKFGIKIKD